MNKKTTDKSAKTADKTVRKTVKKATGKVAPKTAPKKSTKTAKKAGTKKVVEPVAETAVKTASKKDIIRKLAASESRKIVKMLRENEVPETKIKCLKSVIDNVAWMKVELDTAREEIETGDNSSIIIRYDNGGGQNGLRENPLFKGYESLWKSYISGMDKILRALPAKTAAVETKKDTKPRTILELVRDKHKKEA